MTDRLETVLRLLEDGADLDPDERAWLAAEVRRMREARCRAARRHGDRCTLHAWHAGRCHFSGDDFSDFDS